MPSSPATLPVVRQCAVALLRELDIHEPPLPAARCLEARRLAIVPQPLEAWLAAIGVQQPVQLKLDAMLGIRERAVWLRSGLHPNQEQFDTLHEVGHDALPWQRELLYYCSILDLPRQVQREWEVEASSFAADCLFLGERFTLEVRSAPLSLRTAKALAERYAASYAATFRRYVEEQVQPCCLLVSRPVQPTARLWSPDQDPEYEIH